MVLPLSAHIKKARFISIFIICEGLIAKNTLLDIFVKIFIYGVEMLKKETVREMENKKRREATLNGENRRRA